MYNGAIFSIVETIYEDISVVIVVPHKHVIHSYTGHNDFKY